MKPRVLCIIPNSEPELPLWIEGLLELSLIANIEVVSFDWQNEQSGSHTEWHALAELIHSKWSEVDGVMIWAPEQSALGVAGYLSLVFPAPGMPIVTFSAPSPKTLSHSNFLELGLKSVLIKSAFIAVSDLAESVVLKGEEVYRASDCGWAFQQNELALISETVPIANIHYKLEIQAKHLSRSERKPELNQPSKLDQELFFTQFFPGQTRLQIPTNAQVAIVQSDLNSLNDSAFLQAIDDERSKGKTILVYSDVSHKASDGDYLFHPQKWWVALLAQYSFALNKDKDVAIDFITKRLR